MKIGIGYTTHNRRELIDKSLIEIKKFLPSDYELVVVDDASEIPFPEATYRFEENVGIATAKNKCLELLHLAGCEHIFLADDDFYPIKKDWWKPYVESPEKHLMYIFKDFISRPLGDCKLIYEDDQHKAYSHARGCLLYFDASILPYVGGMCPKFARWGFEHIDYSHRIHNLGYTTFRFADVKNSKGLFYSADEHEAVASTVTPAERKQYLKQGRPLAARSKASLKVYPIENIDLITPQVTEGSKNVILTSYLVGQEDPQRRKKWQPSIKELEPLIRSCKKHELVILTDAKLKHKDAIFEKAEAKINPYFQRWLNQYLYLRDHPEIKNVWMVDSTDVQLVNEPFKGMQPGMIYVGDEHYKVASHWMLKWHREPELFLWLKNNRNKQLLNCGVVGGSREDMMTLCKSIFDGFFDTNGAVGPYEMGVFNRVVHEKFRGRFIYGRNITNYFKSFEVKGDWLWAHK